MKYRHLFMGVAALLATTLAFITCSDKDEVEKTQYSISVSPDGTVTVPAEGGTVEFRITTNASRYGHTLDKVDWVSAAFDSSKPYNCDIVTVQPNNSKAERRTTVLFYAETVEGGPHVAEQAVTLVQHGVGELPTTRMSGSLDFGANVSTSGYTVMTVIDAQPVGSGNVFSATTIPSSDLPQPILACNADGDVVLMAREPYDDGDTPTLDARSTALALVTMHPLFAPVKGANEFQVMKKMLLGASAWGAFEAQVAKSVRAGKAVLDASNTPLTTALNALFDEVCVEKSVFALTRAAAPTQVMGRNGERPFKTEVSGSKVNFYNYSLTPMYEGVVYHSLTADEDAQQEVARLVIPTGADYGVTDIFFREGQGLWTPAVTFDFNTLPDEDGWGPFIFHFSRLTDRAKLNFVLNHFCSCLDIIGAAYGTIGTQNWRHAAEKFLLQRGMALTQLLIGGTWSKLELFESTYSTIMDFLTSDQLLEVCGAGASSAAVALAQKLSPVTTIYTLMRGSVNTLTRTYYWLDTPAEVDIHLCRQVSGITTCEKVKLEVVSGDNQQGHSDEFLDDPIRIRVITEGLQNARQIYNLRFAIVEEECGGEVNDEQLATYDLEAETGWKLGRGVRVQHLMVEALDFATGAIVSEPIMLTAVATDVEDDVKKLPIPAELQGTWVQKEGTYDGEPITMELHKYKASFADPQNPNRDFTSLDVWYADQEIVDFQMQNTIYFDDIDPSTGRYEPFLQGVAVRGNTLYVSNTYGSGYCEFVTEDGGEVVGITPDELNFTGEGGSQTATIIQTGYKSFGAKVEDAYRDWLSVQPATGGTIEVTAQPNTTGQPRTGYVQWWVSKFENSTESQRLYQTPIRVTQEAAPSISTDMLTYTADGGTQSIRVEPASYTRFGATVSSEGSEWCGVHAYVEGGCYVDVTVQPNTTGQPRECIVDCWVTNEASPTDEQKVKMPVRVVQEAGATVTENVKGFRSNLHLNIKLLKSVTKDGSTTTSETGWEEYMYGWVNYDNTNEISTSVSGTTLHVDCVEENDRLREALSFDILNFNDKSQKATNIVYTYHSVYSDYSGTRTTDRTIKINGEIPYTKYLPQSSGIKGYEFTKFEIDGLSMDYHFKVEEQKNNGETTITEYTLAPYGYNSATVSFEFYVNSASGAARRRTTALPSMPWSRTTSAQVRR